MQGNRAQVLLHRDGIVGAALYRGIVGDNHAFAARYAADAGDHARARDLAAIHPVRGKRRQFEERRAGIQQALDTFARQQFAAGQVLVACCLRASGSGRTGVRAQGLQQPAHRRRIRAKAVRSGIDG
jgi:hypothetical protein